jgi:hypothetical protein
MIRSTVWKRAVRKRNRRSEKRRGSNENRVKVKKWREGEK